jgi:hypothetical protein
VPELSRRVTAGTLGLIMLCACSAVAAECASDSLAVAMAAGAHLLGNERIYRVVAVPRASWATTEPEYLVDLAPLEPGEIVAQMIAIRHGTSWIFRRERWMFEFPGFVNPRAVRLYPPVGTSRGGEILDTLAPQLRTGEFPVLIEDLTALEWSHGTHAEALPSTAPRRYLMRTQSRVPPYKPNRAFFVGVDGDSVVVESIDEAVTN